MVDKMQNALLNVRIPKDLKTAFKAHCEEIGLTEAAGTRLALVHFMERNGATATLSKGSDLVQAATHVDEVVSAGNTMARALRSLGILFNKE